MKMLRSSILCFVIVLLAAPLLRSQDFSKYRHFTLGMSLNRVLERTEQKIADVKVTHDRPALIQELTWWPPSLPGTSLQSDAVEQILFSFYNGELYKISVTYDRSATEGLTAEDMVKSISEKYGPPTSDVPDFDFALNEPYVATQKPAASWEDSQSSFNLVRSSFSGVLGLVIYSKRVNAEADLAIAEAAKLEKQDQPKIEAERQKKETDDLEAARQKNRKIFHP